MTRAPLLALAALLLAGCVAHTTADRCLVDAYLCSDGASADAPAATADAPAASAPAADAPAATACEGGTR